MKAKVKEEKQMKELRNLESLEAVYIAVFYKINKNTNVD